jgi:hypothetical protein
MPMLFLAHNTSTPCTSRVLVMKGFPCSVQRSNDQGSFSAIFARRLVGLISSASLYIFLVVRNELTAVCRDMI